MKFQVRIILPFAHLSLPTRHLQPSNSHLKRQKLTHTQLLTTLLSLFMTLTSAIPIDSTSDSDLTSIIADTLDTTDTTDVLDTTQSTLVCHAGLPASVCASQYGTSCDGGFYGGRIADNGRSCTSRQCFCLN